MNIFGFDLIHSELVPIHTYFSCTYGSYLYMLSQSQSGKSSYQALNYTNKHFSKSIQTFGYSVDLEDKEEQGFLAGLKIPAPWATGKTIETIHPVRDNYKFKETVHIPGARCLYLRFDPRCTSQYDYDKVSLAKNQGQFLYYQIIVLKVVTRLKKMKRELSFTTPTFQHQRLLIRCL